MSLIRLAIAAVVLLGLGGLIFWVNKHPQEKTATPASAKLLDVLEAQVQTVSVQKKGGDTLTLSKEKGRWAITTPAAYSADQDAVVSMVSSLSGVNADSVIEDAPKNLAQYGLAEPALTVTANEKNGKADRLFFGDDVPAGSQVYARVNKDPKVYSVSSSLKSAFNKELNDLRDKRLLTFDAGQVSRLEIVAPKSDVEFGKVNQTDWQILKPEIYRADGFQVDDLLRKLADAKMDLSGKPEDAKNADAAFKTGHPVAIAKVTDAGGVQSLDVRQNKDDYFAHSSGVSGTFKLASELGKLLAKPVDDFRNKKIFDFGFSDTNRLEIHQSSGDKVYTRTGTDWKSNNQTMDPGGVQSLVDKLRDLTATAFASSGFNSPDIAIKVASNDGKRTEKVEFSRAAGGYVARREGQPALYKLDAKSVDDILGVVSGIKATASGAKK